MRRTLQRLSGFSSAWETSGRYAWDERRFEMSIWTGSLDIIPNSVEVNGNHMVVKGLIVPKKYLDLQYTNGSGFKETDGRYTGDGNRARTDGTGRTETGQFQRFDRRWCDTINGSQPLLGWQSPNGKPLD